MKRRPKPTRKRITTFAPPSTPATTTTRRTTTRRTTTTFRTTTRRTTTRRTTTRRTTTLAPETKRTTTYSTPKETKSSSVINQDISSDYLGNQYWSSGGGKSDPSNIKPKRTVLEDEDGSPIWK